MTVSPTARQELSARQSFTFGSDDVELLPIGRCRSSYRLRGDDGEELFAMHRGDNIVLTAHGAGRQVGAHSETPSPCAFIFSLENAVCKDSYRRILGLPALLPYSSVRILAGSVLQRENKRAWARSYSECSQ